MHKAMVLLLSRCWDYKLKTEDVLELTQGNRRIALCTIVGLLEDGETYSTTLKQRQKPKEGQMAQWEHELIIQRLEELFCCVLFYVWCGAECSRLCRFEKPLLLQICRLLRGFTHPGTQYISDIWSVLAELSDNCCIVSQNTDIVDFNICLILGTYFEASQEELALFKYGCICAYFLFLLLLTIYCAIICRVERFSEEMNQLLEITLRSRLVEKLCVAMYSGIFEEHADDDEEEVIGL